MTSTPRHARHGQGPGSDDWPKPLADDLAYVRTGIVNLDFSGRPGAGGRGLRLLARRFGELAIPEHGRDVGRSALADDEGVSSVPTDVAHPIGRLLLGVGIGLFAGVALMGLIGGDDDR